MLRPFVWFLAIVCASTARADDGSITVRFVTTDGNPVGGAKAWVSDYPNPDKDIREPVPLVADQSGKLTISAAGKGVRYRSLFILDSAGRVGQTSLALRRQDGDGDTTQDIVLVDTSPAKGRVTNAEGKPVVGALVTLSDYFIEGNRPRPASQATSISLPVWDGERTASKTDVDGRFELPVARGEYWVIFRVSAKDLGETRWVSPPGSALEVKLPNPGQLILEVAGVDPSLLKGHGWRLNPTDAEAKATGTRMTRWREGKFDGTAKLTLPGIVPGKYQLEVRNDGKCPAIFAKSTVVEVAAGKTATLTATFGAGVKVAGKITDENGKGLAGVEIFVTVTDGTQNRLPNASIGAATDADGNYSAYGPAGWYTPHPQSLPDGFAMPVPGGNRRSLIEPVKLDAGADHEFPAIALLTTVPFIGRVELADGKPAVGAELDIHAVFAQSQNAGKTKSDARGRFKIPNLPPDDSVAPRVRLGRAVNVPETYVLANIGQGATIKISEANAAAFRGRVLDAKGSPIAGAKVVLREQVLQVGRNASLSTNAPVATTTTNAAGQYVFDGFWPGDRYQIEATADGYSKVDGKSLLGEAGKTADFADVRLARTSMAIAGRVVGPDGKPVAGAEVFGVDGPVRFSTTSAADGTFALKGFYETGGFAFATKAGYRLFAVAVLPGAASVSIALTKADGTPVPPPEVSSAHRAALDRLARFVFTLIYESHATFGYGGNAVTGMASLDLAIAERWRDEEKARTDGKTDFTALVERAHRDKTLFDLSKKDPDAALATLGKLKAGAGYSETLALARKLSVLDKAQSLPFAELAGARAGETPSPDRIWYLAEAGELLVRAGGEAAGMKLLADASTLAAKLGPNPIGRNALAVGLAAAHLAPYDWTKAEGLLNSLADANDYNRFLSAALGRLARTDLEKAKKLLGSFKRDSSYPEFARMRMAYAVAAEKPDEALKLIEDIKSVPYRVLGYIRLAELFRPTDKARAFSMIDTAFELLERKREEFDTYSGMGGNTGMAALGAVRAKELGYPDVPQLIARCLALRPAGNGAHFSADSKNNNTVSLASVIALVDPKTAKQLLATLGTPEEYVQKASAQRREWLFALALADPDQAHALAAVLIERAKESARKGQQGGLSNTGLVELGSILTAPDRLKPLSSYSGVLREIGDDD